MRQRLIEPYDDATEPFHFSIFLGASAAWRGFYALMLLQDAVHASDA